MQSLNSPLRQSPTWSLGTSALTYLRGSLTTRLRLDSPFFIRLRSWEYWPFWVVYVPVFGYWLWLSLRARSFFFFSASNPSIETGGLLGESKSAILDRIDPAYVPKSLFVAAPVPTDSLFRQLDERGLTYPLIAKPDVGERGWRVEKIDHWTQLVNYVQQYGGKFIVQEYIDEPLELGVFYYRMPGAAQGTVSSVVQKDFLSIRGTGHDTIEALIYQNERAILQLPALKHTYGERFGEVLPVGEVLQLVGIGNHCKGTTFLNANHLITPELTRVFDRISAGIEGFYFGRYDLRCRSVADLYAGRHIRIMELNGAGAEPAHIYQPGFSLWTAWGVLLHHWQVLYQISRENHRRGVPYLTFREARLIYQRHQRPTA